MAAATIDINTIDVPQLEGLVAQFYGAGTQEQVRTSVRARARSHDAPNAAPRNEMHAHINALLRSYDAAPPQQQHHPTMH